MRRLSVQASLLVLLTLTACMSEVTDNYTLYDSAWCVVQGRGSQLSLFTDESEILKPTESLDSTRFKAGDRYRVIFVPLGEPGHYLTESGSKLVQIANLQPVLVENALQRHALSTAENDPVWVNVEPFFGGGYLNFDFQFPSSETGVKHGIHLLQDTLYGRTLYVNFVHDAKGDSRKKTASALASFPLSSLQRLDLADSLIVRMKDDYQTHSYRLALKDTL